MLEVLNQMKKKMKKIRKKRLIVGTLPKGGAIFTAGFQRGIFCFNKYIVFMKKKEQNENKGRPPLTLAGVLTNSSFVRL